MDEIVDELEQDPRIAAAYNLWYREREEVLKTYKDDLPERIPLSHQKEFKRIKNIVIGEAAKLGGVAQEFETARANDGDSDVDDDTDQSEHEPPPTPPARSKPMVPPGQGAKSAASLLYQVGRIFEDQRPRPAARRRPPCGGGQ